MAPKGPKNRFSVVPWMNPEQLLTVYEHLYSDDLSNKRWAVDQISVWNTRCHPSLPTSVEATVGIVRATVHDMLYQSDKTLCLEEDIKTLYSMALIRFLNLTLEHHQKAVGKMRLSVLADKHNIPSWLLDLRHEASHSFCPSITMLRLGAETAMKYLRDTFWSKECARAKMKINVPSKREIEIVNLINQYKNLRFLKMNSNETETSVSKDLKDVIRKIGFVILHDREKFIDTLVQPGNFIAAEDIRRLLIGDGRKVSPFIVEEDNLVLPTSIQKFWLPLLRKIHMKDLMPMFLEKLLLAQEKCKTKICQKVAVAWALQIFIGVDGTSTLKDIFQKKELLVDLPRLLFACAKGVTPYSKELLIAFAARYKENEREKLEPLLTLITVYQGAYTSPSKEMEDLDDKYVFTVEDIEENINQKKARRSQDSEVNKWSSPSVSMDFSNIPIGAILTPKASDDDQDMESSEDSLRDLIKLERSDDDNFIIVNKNDEGTVEEEITHDKNTFLETFRPEHFDMIYRRRPNQ